MCPYFFLDMNQKYFLAVMSIRNHANSIEKRVKGVFALDDSGYCYQVDYWDGSFQQFRIGMTNADIVYISPLNTII